MPIRKILSDSNLRVREDASPVDVRGSTNEPKVLRRPLGMKVSVELNTVEESALHVHLKRRTKRIVIWASLNLCAIAFTIVDCVQSPPLINLWLWRLCQIALIVICSCNVLYYFYAFITVRTQTSNQKIRLTSQFKTSTTPVSNKKPEYVRFMPYDSNAATSYWKDFQTIFESFKRMTARNQLAFFPNDTVRSGVDASVEIPQAGTNRSISRQHIADGRNMFSETLSKYKGRIITTAEDLKKYLIDRRIADEFEFVKTSEDSTLYHDSTEFWTGRRRNLSDNCLDISPLLRRSEYQTSPNSSDSSIASNKETVFTNQEFFSLLWDTYRIESSSFIYWISNFRMWLSKTVLTRLISEINVVDNGLRSLRLSGITIGAVSLETLEDASRNASITHQLPSLSFLLPFLRVSTKQNYVAERFQTLSQGHGMGDFKWNGGGEVGGKAWERGYPTDSELIMHVFATYLDQHLPLSPCHTDTAKPFSSNYLFDSRQSARQQKLAIFRQSANPPHYNLLVDNDVQEIPPGRNNLFYAVLLFLYLIKVYEHGMLGRISLGKHGLDMLWIIDEKD